LKLLFIENYQEANNSSTPEAKEKINTDFRILEKKIIVFGYV